MASTVDPATISALRLASRQLVREFGLLRRNHPWGRCSLTEGYTLLELGLYNELRVHDLVAKLNLDKSTVSRALTQLARQKLVVSRADPFDKRSKWFALSGSGKKFCGRIDHYAERQAASALEQMSATERSQLVESVSRYAKALKRVRVLEQFSIRPIRPSDDKALLSLFIYVRREHIGFDETIRLSFPDDHNLSRRFKGPRSRYWVVENEGRIVGGAGVAPLKGGDSGTCELQKMYLLPEARGIGLAEMLLETRIRFAREKGFDTLYAETNAQLTRAVAFYKKRGFQLLDRPLGETGHAAVTDLYFALPINSYAAPRSR